MKTLPVFFNKSIPVLILLMISCMISKLHAQALSATTSATNTSCNGLSNGRASVTASGGAGGYSYSWAPSGGTASLATGLSAGNYTVTVTDALSASVTATVTVTQPLALSATTGFTNTSCSSLNNGRASVSVSGGSPSYFYSWAPSGGTASLATGLGANNYTCTITDNNSCTRTVTVTVTAPSSITAVTSATAVTCNGGNNGRASVSASGGTSPYFYSWAPSGGTASTATGLASNNYTVTVTDNNSCTRTTTIAVSQPSAINTSTSTVNASCFGYANGVVAVSASGGTSPYTYTWSPTGGNSPVAVGMAAGSYTVNGRDNNGCTFSRICNVNQPPALVASSSFTNTTCNGGSNGSASVSASGGTPGYVYSWAPGGGGNATATGLSAGTYTCTIEDVSLCPLTQTVTVGEPTAISTTTAVTNVACNGGANGSATVTVSGGTGAYTYSWTPGGGTAASVSGLAAGNYTVTVTDANNCTTTAFANVTQPTALTTSTAVTNVACNGGSNGVASISGSGGAGGYTYLWSTGSSLQTITGQMMGVYTATVTDANNCKVIKSAQITQPTALVTTTAVTNVLCNGGSTGSATVTASGGAGGYSYLWSNGASTSAINGVMAAVYTATVTDANSCTSIKSAQVTQPTAISTSTALTNNLCNGGSTGSATVTASGGTGSYTYLWSTGATTSFVAGQITGVKTVTVTDANNCKGMASVNIQEPTTITTSTAVTNVLCNSGSNGSATVTATGGTGAYTYIWSPSGGTAAVASGLMAGNYTVTVTDANNCQKTASVTIQQPTAISTSTALTNVLCNGGSTGSATVTVSGGTAGYTYLWSTGATTSVIASQMTGVKTVTVTDANNCTRMASVNIQEPTAISTSTALTNILCNGGSTGSATVTVSGGTGSYTYNWAPSGGTAATATGLTAGNYTVTVTDANSCTRTATANLTQPTLIVATPTQTNASCASNNGIASVAVTGGIGSYTYNWAPSGGTAATASGLAAGNYTVTITDGNSCTKTQAYTIGSSAGITGVITTTALSCNGGSNGAASISATGGTGAYSYTWTPGNITTATASALSSGTYTVQVKDGGSCTVSFTTNVSQPTAVSVTLTQTNVACNGGSTGMANINVTGGTAPYTYSWTPNAVTTPTVGGLNAGTYTVIIRDANLCQTTRTVTITEPAILSAISSHTNVTCNGASNGSANITASGGTGVYSYTWSPAGGNASSATALTAGNYSVMVSDANNCMLTQTLTITQPSPIVAIMSHTNMSCFGLTNGSAQVTATGGTGAYTYTWMPGGNNTATISNQGAGTYTVDVKDGSNCQVNATVTIIEPAAIAYTQSVSICQGQSLTVGASVYSVAGTYTNVLISTAGCDSTVTTVLSVNPLPTLTLTASSNSVCAGTSATLTATGATTYTWTNGVTNGVGFIPSSTQDYTVTGTNSGCSVTATIGLTVNPMPSVTANATSTLICTGNTVTLTGSGATTYTWSNGVIDGTSFSPTTTVTYTVTGASISACTNTAVVTVSVSACTGIEVYSTDVTVMVYPNPVTSKAIVNISNFDQLPYGKINLELYDNTGRLVKQLQVTSAETLFSSEGLAEGMYHYHITSNGSALLKGKLIIQ